MPGESFLGAYDGKPPWDIDRPQPAFERALDEGVVRGRVLDVGCGTGEHVLLFAQRGLDATGLDFVPKAIDIANRKARERGVGRAKFVVGDALELGRLGQTFDTVTDSGCFHTFADEERRRFVASLAAALKHGGRYVMMCFSERETGWGGPRRVTQREIRETFRSPEWIVESIEAARFEAALPGGGAEAWLAVVRRA